MGSETQREFQRKDAKTRAKGLMGYVSYMSYMSYMSYRGYRGAKISSRVASWLGFCRTEREAEAGKLTGKLGTGRWQND